MQNLRILPAASGLSRALPLREITACDPCAVRSLNLCAAMPDYELARLAAIAVPIEVRAGRTFIFEADPATHFYNVTSGTAKLFKLLSDGRRIITGFAEPGDFLGLAGTQNYGFSAEAMRGMRLCRYSRASLKELLGEFPLLSARLLEIASAELLAAHEQMMLLGRKLARERLASFIISRFALRSRHAEEVRLPMSRRDLADYLGLSIETVCRTVTRLTTDGIIALPSANRIRILDLEALHLAASGQ